MNVPGAELRLKELCRRLSEISDCELESFCEIPWGYATRAAGRQFHQMAETGKRQRQLHFGPQLTPVTLRRGATDMVSGAMKARGLKPNLQLRK